MGIRYKTLHPYLAALAVLFILCLAGFTYLFGPLDSFPRLHASAQSPDGELTVEVYRKRVSLPPSSRIELIAKVYDKEGHPIFEKTIFAEGMWSELDSLCRNIVFAEDQIRIGPSFDPYWNYVIDRAELRAAENRRKSW